MSFLVMIERRYFVCSESATMLIKKFTALFPSGLRSVFVWHFIGKILSFEFYPKAVFFEWKFRISRSAFVHVKNWSIGLQSIKSRIRWRQLNTHQLKIAACKRSLLTTERDNGGPWNSKLALKENNLWIEFEAYILSVRCQTNMLSKSDGKREVNFLIIVPLSFKDR